MITKREAAAKAKERWNEIDYCTEYENAYVFSKHGHKAFGGPGPVVVLKDTGDVVNMTYFVDNIAGGSPVSEDYL